MLNSSTHGHNRHSRSTAAAAVAGLVHSSRKNRPPVALRYCCVHATHRRPDESQHKDVLCTALVDLVELNHLSMLDPSEVECICVSNTCSSSSSTKETPFRWCVLSGNVDVVAACSSMSLFASKSFMW